MSSTATISTTVRTASSAAAIWGRSRPTDGRSRPRRCRPGTPRWGAQWKKAVKENYQSALKPGTGVHGSMYSYRDVYVDLDPTYKDRFGRPLARITMDFHDNEIKQNAFLTDKFAEIFQAMGAKQVRQGISQGAVRHHQIPDHASVRGRRHGHRSLDQRDQSLFAELGCAEPVRDGRERASRRTPVTIRPARWRRWPIGPRTRSATNISKLPDS